MKSLPSRALFGAAVIATGLATAPKAQACGGFFCSQAQPVNQAAERIIFSQNGDGTVTAVIQIMYEGPSENFSWLLPLSSVPDPQTDDIAVASDIAFQRLQAATNPRYSLTTRVEGECRSESDQNDGFGGVNMGATDPAAGAPEEAPGGVTVEASGVVGSFEWTVISLDEELDDPADAAVLWLEDNGFDVTDDAPDLIGPYLADGMFLLALKLVKGADTGSIRPIVLTYDADSPMIPIKLTAVAANDDMGVMAWVAGDEQAIPDNYLSLELNEARINWFNASSNYGDVVNEAADEAGGQGFVTESAGPSSQLSQVVWSASDDYTWEYFTSRVYNSFSEMFSIANAYYGGWDGFWDAIRQSVALPEDVTLEDFRLCPNCYADSIEFSPSTLVENLEANVIEPVRLVQELLDSRDYVTRLYTTMSAGDMTLDPLFSFNGDLNDISNVHTAERIIECDSSVYQSEAPWRIELPQGGVVRGEGQNLTWPEQLDDQPATTQIRQLGSSGDGMVVTDNTVEVADALETYNSTVGTSTANPGGAGTTNAGGESSGDAGQGGSTAGGNSAGGQAADSAGGDGSGGDSGDDQIGAEDDGGCSVSAPSDNKRAPLALLSTLALGLLVRRRRAQSRG